MALFYNKAKVGVDILDQMSRQYSVKSGSRRWPVHVLYNITDMSLINAWVVYKAVTQSHLSRWKFIQCC